MGKRGITVSISNPKWPKNPKWKGNSQSSTTSTSQPSSTSTSDQKTTASSTKSTNGSGQIIVGGGISKTLAASEPTQSKSSSSSDSIKTQAPSSSSTASASASKTSTKSEAPLVLPTPPSSSCAKLYTNMAGGAVFGPGKGDFTYSPRPSTFVKRNGGKLTLDGETYRITGPSESRNFEDLTRILLTFWVRLDSQTSTGWDSMRMFTRVLLIRRKVEFVKRWQLQSRWEEILFVLILSVSGKTYHLFCSLLFMAVS